MPLPFRDVYDRWERSKSFGDPRDLTTFSSDMNDVTGTDDFSAGQNAGWWTRTSTALDKNVFEPIARQTGLEYAGRKIGGLFGPGGEEVGAQVARGLPRTVAQTVPLAAAELLSGGAATPLVAGAAVTGGLFGAQTYAETQSPKAALLSGATAAALPAVGRIGGNIALRTLGPPVERVVSEEGVSSLLPKVAADTARYKATQLFGSQAAMISALQGSQAGQAAIMGVPYNPWSPDFWAQQIPYTLFDIARTTGAKVPTVAQAKPEVPPPRGGKPDVYVPPESTPEAHANAASLLDKISALAKDAATTPEQSGVAFTEALNGVQNPNLAVQQKPSTGEVTLTGRFKQLENGNLKMLVTDVQGMELPEHSNVFVNINKGQGQYKVELNKADRTATITIPRKFVGTSVEYPLSDKDFPAAQAGQEVLKPAVPIAGATVPEDNLLSLRQKAEQTFANKDLFDAALKGEPKDEAKAIPYWRDVIDKMTPADLQPGVEPPKPVDNATAMELRKKGYNLTTINKMTQAEAQRILGAAPEVPAPTTPTLSMDERLALQGERIQVLPDEIPYDATLFHGTQIPVQKFVAGKPVYLTSELEAAKSYAKESSRAAEGARVPPREGRPRILKVSATFEKVADTDTVEKAMKDLGVTDSIDDIFQGTGRDTEKVFNHLIGQGYDAIRGFDQNAITGEPIDTTIALRPENLQITSTRAAMKTAIQDLEQAKADTAKAVENINKIPASPQDVPDLLPPDPKPQIELELKAGHTPTQAIEKVRLQTQTPQVDEYQQLQKIARDKLRELGRNKAKPVETKAGTLTDSSGKTIKFDSPDEADAYLDQHKARNPDDQLEYRVAKLRGKWLLRVKPREVSIERVSPLEVAQRAPEMTTEMVDVENLRDQILTEAATTPLTEQEGGSQQAAPDQRPQVSLDDYKKQLDLASNAPSRVMNAGGFADLPDTIQAIRQFRAALDSPGTELGDVNATLFDAGLPEFKTAEDMQRTFRMVRDGMADFTGKTRSFALESEIPHDRELVKAIGIQDPRGLGNFLDWYIKNQPDSALRELAEGLRKFSDFSHVDTTFEPKGHWYDRADLTGTNRPRINIGSLPSDHENALNEWSPKVLEEIAHDTTAQLLERTDPAAIAFKAEMARILDTVRKSNRLPSEVRRALSKSIKEDWYGDWSRDGTDMWERYNKELPGREDWWPIFYSLQNGHELVGGIFGSPKFIRLLQDVQMPKTQSHVLNFFAKVWSRMFGYSPNAENAFARLISSYDNYLSGTRMSKSYNGMNYIRDMLIATGVKPEALASRIDAISNVYGRGDLRPSIEAFEREMKDGFLPATTAAGEVNPQLRDAVMTGDAKAVGDATSNLLVGELPQHQELWARMKQDLQIAKTLYNEAKKGTVPAEVSLFQEGLNAENVKLNAMKRALDKQAIASDRWQAMDSLGNSDGIKRLWSGTLKGDLVPDPADPTGNEDIARQALGLEPKGADFIAAERRRVAATGEKIPWLDRNFKFATFTSEEYPGFKPVFQTVKETQADAHRRMTELQFVKNADPETKTVTREIADANKRVATTPGLNRIASDMLRRAQVLEKMRKPVTFDDPEMQAALRRASDAKRRGGRSDRDDVITAFNSESHRSQHRVDQVIPQHLSKMNEDMTTLSIIGREVGMPFQRAEDLSQQLYGALAQLKDPTTAAQGSEALKAVAAGMKPDTFVKVLQQATGFIQDSEKHIATLQRYRYYIGEQRYGKFHLVMSREGEPLRESYDTEKAARARAKELATDGWTLQDIIPKSQTNVAQFIAATDPVLGSMQELDQQALNRLETIIADLPVEKQAAIRPLIQRAADYEASNAAFSPVPSQASPRRRFVAGRESIDMIANADEETGRFVNWMRHRETRVRTAAQMLDPEMLGNRPIREYSTNFVDTQLAPDNPIARRLSEGTFYWNLAGNFGVDFLHAIQSLTTGMASVISETGGVGDAMKYVMGASGKVFKRYTTGKWSDPKTQWFINWLTARGGLGLPAWGDVFDPSTMNYFRNAGPDSLFGKTMNALKWGVRGYKGIFLKHNDMVGGLAGFQLGLDRGMSLEDAARFGEGVKDRGFYSAGKVQRSVGVWNTKNKAVPQLMLSLRTYTLGWFSQLAHNWKVGFAGAPGEYTPAQRQGAKNAFLYMLGAQATLAGALGLPGVGQGLALLKQSTGVDLKSWTRQNLAKMFGEDQDDYGGFVTGMALHGLVAQFAPFDPSGRHIPNFPFIGVTPQKGFDIASLIPAPFSTASDMIGGVMSAARGEDPSRLLPQALRGPVSLIQGEGDIRNSKGELIYKLSPSERFVKMLGLEPSRVAAAKETAATVDSLNKAAAAQRQKDISEVATLFRKGDSVSAQRRMAEIGQKNPTYDMAGFVRGVSSEVEKQTYPYDWKREVNPAVDIAGLSSPWPSQELERRQFRRGVESDLGLPSPLNPVRGDMRAATLDQLLNTNPYMTRSQALRSLLEAQPTRRRSAFSLPQEYQ